MKSRTLMLIFHQEQGKHFLRTAFSLWNRLGAETFYIFCRVLKSTSNVEVADCFTTELLTTTFGSRADRIRAAAL